MGATLSRGQSLEQRPSAVRVVLPCGRRRARYFRHVSAQEVMLRYPHHLVVQPDIFSHSGDIRAALVPPESVLTPGMKYRLVPHSQIKKLLDCRNSSPEVRDLELALRDAGSHAIGKGYTAPHKQPCCSPRRASKARPRVYAPASPGSYSAGKSHSGVKSPSERLKRSPKVSPGEEGIHTEATNIAMDLYDEPQILVRDDMQPPLTLASHLFKMMSALDDSKEETSDMTFPDKDLPLLSLTAAIQEGGQSVPDMESTAAKMKENPHEMVQENLSKACPGPIDLHLADAFNSASDDTCSPEQAAGIVLHERNTESTAAKMKENPHEMVQENLSKACPGPIDLHLADACNVASDDKCSPEQADASVFHEQNTLLEQDNPHELYQTCAFENERVLGLPAEYKDILELPDNSASTVLDDQQPICRLLDGTQQPESCLHDMTGQHMEGRGAFVQNQDKLASSSSPVNMKAGQYTPHRPVKGSQACLTSSEQPRMDQTNKPGGRLTLGAQLAVERSRYDKLRTLCPNARALQQYNLVLYGFNPMTGDSPSLFEQLRSHRRANVLNYCRMPHAEAQPAVMSSTETTPLFTVPSTSTNLDYHMQHPPPAVEPLTETEHETLQPLPRPSLMNFRSRPIRQMLRHHRTGVHLSPIFETSPQLDRDSASGSPAS